MKATIVIHSRVRSLIGDGTSMEWHSVTAVGQPGSAIVHTEEIDRAQAQELIKQHGLVVMHDEQDGEIYDTPEGAFRYLFPKGATQSLLSKLKKNGL